MRVYSNLRGETSLARNTGMLPRYVSLYSRSISSRMRSSCTGFMNDHSSETTNPRTPGVDQRVELGQEVVLVERTQHLAAIVDALLDPDREVLGDDRPRLVGARRCCAAP